MRFRALRSRNYRLYFMGQSLSLIGSWMQNIAMSWLVLRLTGSGVYLGLVSFTSQFPIFLVAPFAGVWLDRIDRRKLLQVTQTLSLLQALTLGVLVLTDHIAVWHVITLSVFLGMVNAFDMPGRQSLVAQMVDRKEDLSNAIALNSMVFNGARLIGPALAGYIIASFGESACFLMNGLSYLALIVSLRAMTFQPLEKAPRRYVWQEMKEGFLYAYRVPSILTVLFLLSVISLIAMPYGVLVPIFAKDVLMGGPKTLGYLMSSVGIGAVCGAWFLASRTSVVGLEKIIFRALVVLSIGLLALSLTRHLVPAMLTLLLVGFGMMVNMASSNTVLQTILPEDKRGRIMSLYVMTFTGVAPIGNLLAGFLAGSTSAPITLAIGGVLCMVALTVFAPRTRALGPVIIEATATVEKSGVP